MHTHDCKIIGIAGGSGVGKSTLAIGLVKKYPDQIALLHVDDYFKKSAEVPKMGDSINWDHPDAIRFDDLYHDIVLLMHRKPVEIMTKSELYNPDYKLELRNKIPYTVASKPIILIEGYLAFHDMHIRDLMSLKVYLDMPIEETLKRRTKFTDEKYYQDVLIPMHDQFVKPTKAFADLVIDVSKFGISEVRECVEARLKDWLK